MGRDLALERAWRKRMREQERSGLTIRQFCQQEGLVDHQFSWWRKRAKTAYRRIEGHEASHGDGQSSSEE